MNLTSRLEALIDYAAISGFHWRPADGTDWNLPWEPEFALLSGDPDYHCFREGNSFVLRKQERGEFSKPRIISDRIDDIEKFLSFTLGNGVRQATGLANIWLPTPPAFVLGSTVGGYRLEGTPADVTISWAEQGVPRRVSGLTEDRAEEFVQYASFSAADIRKSFLDPVGLPLFSRR